MLDRFRDPADPLKFLIVTAKLLTGFDAPIHQVMYLDKLMKDHSTESGAEYKASQLPLSTLNGFDTHFGLFCQFRSAMNPEKRYSR